MHVDWARRYFTTLELEEEARAAFIEDACRDDDELRQEVENLLADYTRARDFLEQPLAVIATGQPAAEGEQRRHLDWPVSAVEGDR